MIPLILADKIIRIISRIIEKTFKYVCATWNTVHNLDGTGSKWYLQDGALKSGGPVHVPALREGSHREISVLTTRLFKRHSTRSVPHSHLVLGHQEQVACRMIPW